MSYLVICLAAAVIASAISASANAAPLPFFPFAPQPPNSINRRRA
jgi:hypothetical protein